MINFAPKQTNSPLSLPTIYFCPLCVSLCLFFLPQGQRFTKVAAVALRAQTSPSPASLLAVNMLSLGWNSVWISLMNKRNGIMLRQSISCNCEQQKFIKMLQCSMIEWYQVKRNILQLDGRVGVEKRRRNGARGKKAKRKSNSEWRFDRKLFFYSLFIFLFSFSLSWALVVSPIRRMNVRHFLTMEQVDLHTSLRRERKTYKWNGNCFLWNLWHLTDELFVSCTHESIKYTMSPMVKASRSLKVCFSFLLSASLSLSLSPWWLSFMLPKSLFIMICHETLCTFSCCIHLKRSIYSISQVIAAIITCIQVWNRIDWCDKFVILFSQQPDEWVGEREAFVYRPRSWSEGWEQEEGESEKIQHFKGTKKSEFISTWECVAREESSIGVMIVISPTRYEGLRRGRNTTFNCHATVWDEYFHTHTHIRKQVKELYTWITSQLIVHATSYLHE